MGTTAVTATRRFAETLQRQGVEYVDDPIDQLMQAISLFAVFK